MNLMGKIFTFLILMMSLVFLIVAVMVGASDRNWKQLAADLDRRAKQAEASLAGVQSSTVKMQQQLESERVSRAQQLANLQSQLKLALDQKAELETQFGAAKDLSQKRLDELEAAQSRLVQQESQMVALQLDNKKLVDEIAKQFNDTQALQIRNNEQRTQILTLEKDMSDLVDTLAKSKKVLRMNGLDENQLTAHIPEPVESIVTTVTKEGLFVVSVGEDDGIRAGHEMTIYRGGRGGRYIGQGKVLQANNNRAVLRAIDGLMQSQVREGDYVSTKL